MEPADVAAGYVGQRCREQVRFIRPPYCERCGLPYAGDLTTRFECSNCRELQLRFQAARAAVVTHGPVRDVIHRYKYHRALWFEPFLAGLLIGAAAPTLATEPGDVIVPVPLHPVRKREREFNQAERLARWLGRAVDLPVRTDLLVRSQATPTQTRLTRAERAANVRRAFGRRPGRLLRGERVILVDDVLTTGATASACTAVLHELGAGEVRVWTVARGT